MNKNKLIVACILVLAVLALQLGAAHAASPTDGTDLTGTVNGVMKSTDANGNTVFVVTLTDANGTAHTVQLSAEDAANLGLATKNPDGTYSVNNNAVGTTITIPGDKFQGDGCDGKEDGMVAQALSDFFCKGGQSVLGKSVTALHNEGFGFGEIAQACFMAESLKTTCDKILTAKQNHDYSGLGLPDGIKNWGQLRKYALAEEIKSLTNLGAIVSGRAGNPTVTGTPVPTPFGPWNPNAFGPGPGNGHGHGNGNGHGNGHGHDKP